MRRSDRPTPGRLFSASCLIVALLAAGALPAAEDPSGDLPQLTAAPLIEHLAPDRVIVHLQTDRPAELVVEYVAGGVSAKQIRVRSHGRPCPIAVEDLVPGRDYRLKIEAAAGRDVRHVLAECSFESSCDRRPCDAETAASPYPNDELAAECAETARRIVEVSGVDQGYALVLGCGQGRLVLELARRTRMQVIGVEADALAADAARRALDRAGVYGVRSVVHNCPLDKLPYTGDCFNLVVSAALGKGTVPFSLRENRDSPPVVRRSPLATPAAEVCRVLRPCGGVAWIGQGEGQRKPADTLTLDQLQAWVKQSPLSGWKIARQRGLQAVLRRGEPEGAGRWTHQYADAGNTACSGDLLQAPVDIQWFGRPGPRQTVDRHNRPMSPLAGGGRLFTVGDNRIKAVDAYNGTPLWEWTVAGSRRTAVTRDCAPAVLADDLLYVAAGDGCTGFDVAAGRPAQTFAVPQLDPQKPRHFGYVACVDGLLLGSARKPGASFSRLSHDSWKPGYLDNQPAVVSDWLFCLDRHGGRVLWMYGKPEQTAILNTAIAAGDGRLCFLESRNRAAVNASGGRARLQVLLAEGDVELAALDLKSGRVAWRRPVDLSALRHAAYLSCARGTLLVTGSCNRDGHPHYRLAAFRAADGAAKWSAEYTRSDKKPGGDHGEQDQHPVIVDGTVYSRPRAFDLETGRPLPFDLDRAGRGCGALSASALYLFGRGSNPRLYPTAAGGRNSTPLTAVTRPGCWINMIPAGRLLLIPEGSSGCECDYPVQTSIAFSPRTRRNTVKSGPSQSGM